jgi:hypothetical protein
MGPTPQAHPRGIFSGAKQLPLPAILRTKMKLRELRLLGTTEKIKKIKKNSAA